MFLVKEDPLFSLSSTLLAFCRAAPALAFDDEHKVRPAEGALPASLWLRSSCAHAGGV